MGESRTLWEIGPAGSEIRELRARLGLDSGYLSRVLSSLRRQRLIRLEASPHDRRVRFARLTAAGRVERARLDSRSDGVAEGLLAPLTAAQRLRLVKAMGEVERLLRASLVRIGVEDPATRDARWCVQRYFAELGRRFEGGFDPALSIPAAPSDLVPPTGAFFIARLRGRPVGCGAVKLHRRAPAELKRMWVDESARGIGLGRRILAELERWARRHGAKTARLETNRALFEAIALYRSTGYREVPAFNAEPYAHHWFEKELRLKRGSNLA